MNKLKSNVLRLQGFSVHRDRPILRNVDWTVRPGEHWALMGPNGGGKTTLLNALLGYMTPADGVMELLGQAYGDADWRDVRRPVGLVSSSLLQQLEPGETVLETVASGRTAMINFWGTMTRRDRVEAKALLRQVEAGGMETRRWGVLSQGERQRVLIARALMARPRLLILDEPCAGLDPAARGNFLAFLQRFALRRDSPTMILATHHVEEIVPAFTHVLVLKGGRVLAAGGKEKVLTSRILSKAFGAVIRIRQRRGRYELSVVPRAGAVV